MTITKSDYKSRESEKVKNTNPILMIEKNIIQYNDEDKIIHFIGNITSFVFYNQLFEALREHYKINGVAVAPVLSFVSADYIDPVVVPNLISLGFILKSIHNTPIKLDIDRINVTKFLDEGWFFKAVGTENVYSEELVIDESGISSTIKQNTGYDIYKFNPKIFVKIFSFFSKLIFNIYKKK